jgi:hypothetical protein
MASAQAITVRGHTLGETVDQFFSISGFPGLVSNCVSIAGNKKAMKKAGLDPAFCQEAVTAGSGTRAVTTDPSLEPANEAVLDKGRLVEFNLHLASDYSKIVADLIEKFGKPAHTGESTLQNTYGVEFHVSNGTWQMPDGSMIFASEGLSSDDQIDNFRIVTNVTFASKAEADKQNASVRPPPNIFQ